MQLLEAYNVLRQLRSSFVTVSFTGWLCVAYVHVYFLILGALIVGKSFFSVKKSIIVGKVCVYEVAHTLVPMGVSGGTAHFKNVV